MKNDALRRYVLTTLSLLPTPLLLFVSSSTGIYSRNQALLQYQVAVLTPFLELSLVTLWIGGILAAVSRYHTALRFALCAYYVTGPLFLVFAFLRGLHLPAVGLLTNTTNGLLFWPLLLIVATTFLTRYLNPQIVRGLAVFGAVLLASEGATLLYGLQMGGHAAEASSQSPGSPRSLVSSPLPNIYHLIFDAYQTDLFEHTVTPQAEEALGGFVYFPKNTAVVAYTPMSISSVLSGRWYAYDRSRADYMREAFKSKASLLYWLRSQKYETYAYVTNAWQNRDGLFDHMVRHGDAALDELLALNTEAIWNLWLYSNLPSPIRDRVMRTSWFSQLNEEDLKQLQQGRLLPYSAPVTSYLGFQKLMADEAGLPASGRYTLVHVVIPHYPLKLGSDCSYSAGSSKTSVIEQSQCALKLIQDFVSLLKKLGRFDNSLILIHGDHGGPYRTRDGVLVSGARSRSLHAVLLLKPMGTSGEGKLRVLDSDMSLLKIPSLIMSSVEDARSARSTSEPWTQRRAVVPYVEGELIDSAEAILERNGFGLGDVKKKYSNQYPEGTVLSQDPPPYQDEPTAEKVAVVVSEGVPDAADVMPDFVGRDIAEASAWLDKRSSTAAIHRVSHAGAPEGMVVRQTPRPGARTGEKGEVVLYVSNGN
jgi:PASTA domain